MTSPIKYDSAHLYKLTASKRLFLLEIFLHFLVLTCMINLINDDWFWLFLLLFLLLSFHFFTTGSIRTQFDRDTLEFRNKPVELIWRDGSRQNNYRADSVKIIITRWFILLQLGKGRSRKNRLLLPDSFIDNSHYTSFRRQIYELYLC